MQVFNQVPEAKVSAKTGPNGETQLTIEDVRRAISADVTRGGNSVANSFERVYRLGRGSQ